MWSINRSNLGSEELYEPQHSFSSLINAIVAKHSRRSKSTATVLEWIIYLIGGRLPKYIRGQPTNRLNILRSPPPTSHEGRAREASQSDRTTAAPS
jgi:hypothetical protein